MYLRLAFAVAAHLETEILLVDEVLAVGDASFQRKCMQRVGGAAREGRTVLFVSHSMAAVASLCKETILLEGGSVKARGLSSDIISEYLTSRTNVERGTPGANFVRHSSMGMISPSNSRSIPLWQPSKK
jgi:lipopolysaccharide transport system ATP-binding protein